MGHRAAEPLMLNDISVNDNNELGELSLRLDAVKLSIDAGEWLTVVGVNGSGKSTLARLLAGLQPDGMNGEVKRGFAGDGVCPIVLQQPRSQLFGETPREEIVFALEWRGISAAEIPDLVEKALDESGLTELADEPWERMSGGQQQLAAIAAATACDTPLLVLDEVTSMLDEKNRDTVMRTVRAIHKKGAAVVWVTQRLDELDSDSRVVAIREGRVIFDGNSREFLYGGSGAVAPLSPSIRVVEDACVDELSPLSPCLSDEGVMVDDNAAGASVGELSSLSPCLRAGLRLPYMAVLALELRRRGILNDPLPVTAEQWRKVWGNVERIGYATNTAR